MHACMRTYIHTYTHTCIRACIHTCTHTYIHIYIHTSIHTYIHTYTTYINTNTTYTHHIRTYIHNVGIALVGLYRAVHGGPVSFSHVTELGGPVPPFVCKAGLRWPVYQCVLRCSKSQA